MRALVPVMMAAALLGVEAQPATAQAPMPGAMMMAEGAMLTVNAEGKTKVAPDIATINIGVATQGATADAAVAANSAKMNAVLAALKKQGVADKDTQTANLSVNPQYQYNQGEQPKVTGYEANNSVTVKLRDLKKVGKTVDAVVAVGSNQINGISFGLDDDTKALDAARVDAVKNARARAEIYAAATGMKIQRIVAISEGGSFAPPYPMPMVAMARAEKMDASPPVAPGELNLSVNVSITFLLK